MEKRDISGKKYYKELLIKPIKQNLSHHCFIAVRTVLNPLDFFAAIYRHSYYLFQLSEHTLDIEMNSTNFSFQTFGFQDILSEYTAFCIVNQSIQKEGEGEKNSCLLGTENKNTCFILPQKRNKNQFSISFKTENEEFNIGREENDWNLFKNNIECTSVNLMDKIDYLFPIEIRTYEILKPLFLEFSNITFLHHQYIDTKHIKDANTFLIHWAYYMDNLTNYRNKLQTNNAVRLNLQNEIENLS